MLQFPYGVYPNNGKTLDGSKENIFSCIISGTMCTAYQITIMDNNSQTQVYEGTKTSVSLYNMDELNMTVPANSFANGKDLIWKMKLWTDKADIPSFVRDEEGGTATRTMVDYIETPYYFFKSRSTPIVSITNFSAEITDKKFTFLGSFSQAQNVSIQYYTFNLYNGQDLIDTTGKIFSSNLTYSFDGFISGQNYDIELICVDQNNVEVSTGKKNFSVNYQAPILGIRPDIEVEKDIDAITISWSADKQSIPKSFGEYSILKNMPFYGTNSVSLKKNSYIYYDTVSGEELSIDSSNFTVLMSTNINDNFVGKIVELSGNDGSLYIVGFDGTYFYYKINEAEPVNILSPYTSTLFLLKESASEGIGYTWKDNYTWDDSLFWTEPITKISDNQYKITIKPNQAIVKKVE